MAGLDDLWSRFSLTKEEERGVEVPRQKADVIHRLAGRFFTKMMVNVDAIARTFKPLWKPISELKIRDVGENILLFEFENVLDLERVLEFEPWSYDKNLVAFQRVKDVELVPYLNYSHASFWVQLHNLLEKSLMCEMGELIGKSIGVVVKVADPEDDGAGGEFLRVRVTLDISKPLPHCSKLKSEGRQLGCVGIKYEHLPNFCYWRGYLTHGERECEKWLRGKENLWKDD